MCRLRQVHAIMARPIDNANGGALSDAEVSKRSQWSTNLSFGSLPFRLHHGLESPARGGGFRVLQMAVSRFQGPVLFADWLKAR